MVNIGWLLRRLSAMPFPEIMWRLSQKGTQLLERRRFQSEKVSVTSRVFTKDMERRLDASRLGLILPPGGYTRNREIPLLCGFDYEKYRKAWHAGFQTEACWPLEWSYHLRYKQRDDIGDARTNWELNRHFQFALLAKDYAVTGNREYLDELMELFESWNKENPFLWGISWTSVMEIAIRCSNWCYAYAFFAMTSEPPQQLMTALQTGVINMTEYITRHYSRYSSANNHLIVEAYAIGQSGMLFQHQPWIDLAVKLLTRELPRQNFTDGVNKEQSLHYQVFYMEAMGLMWRLLKKNGRTVPESWTSMLRNMCRYLVACRGERGELIEFGDDDEGKILDLQGGVNYTQYVLELFSCLLEERYADLADCTENIRFLFTEAERADAMCKPLYSVRESRCFREGGNSILRSRDGRVLIGIDHAPLGFGSIAAHGHADALSFQLFLDGERVFADPGTYIYHCNLPRRNADRSTANHNTVCVDGRNQSEMLGAFLWGKKAVCTLTEANLDGPCDVIEAEHDGYAPIRVRRRFEFDRERTLVITDTVEGQANATVTFELGPAVEVITIESREVWLRAANHSIRLSAQGTGASLRWDQREQSISLRYGIEQPSVALTLHFACDGSARITTTIHMEERADEKGERTV